jgi:hypothetical protein
MKILQRLGAGAAMTLSLGAAAFGQHYTETKLVSNTSGVAPVTGGLSVSHAEVTIESNDETQIRQRDIAWEEAVHAQWLVMPITVDLSTCEHEGRAESSLHGCSLLFRTVLQHAGQEWD